jgi:succinate-semialdehyde dehydrogenase/glutarate-semialdehyde dehydrogenase
VPELASFVRVIHGDGSVGAALVAAQPDYIFLTGSGPTAQKILHAAADTLTPVACELGGKDPLIVLDDANIKQAARWSAWAAFSNSGQACMSVERVYVLEAVYDKFVEAVTVETNALQMGYSPERSTPYHLGPMTTPQQLNIVESHVQDALNKGAQVLTGGQRRGAFFEPTIVVGVNHTMQIMREETFGPVMPIMRVADEAEAIRLANQSQYGLSGSVWSKNLARAERVAHQLQTASVVINDAFVHFGVSLLPFGGIKQSGFGRTHGQAGLMEFTQPYTYVLGGPPPALDVATVLRKPGHYYDGAALVRFLFGTSLKQKAGGLVDLAKMGAESQLLRKTAAVGVVSGATAAVLTWLNRQKA